MAEKGLGIFHFSNHSKIEGAKAESRSTEQNSILYDMMSAYGNGIKSLREEFRAAFADAEALLASGELGTVGLAKEKKRIEREYREKVEALSHGS